jgi:hypothetical protein
MRTGVVAEPLRVLDRCRTAPAVVTAVDGDTVDVLAPSLVWDGHDLRLGPWEPRVARWRADGLAFTPTLDPGDMVSLHWDFVCDRITPKQAAALDRATRRALATAATTV